MAQKKCQVINTESCWVGEVSCRKWDMNLALKDVWNLGQKKKLLYFSLGEQV